MTKAQHRSLARYIRAAADVLGLRDWAITLDSEPCEDEAHAATVVTIRERRHAFIRVAPEFATYDAEEQRHVIAHELAHVHMDGDLDYLTEVLPHIIGIATWVPMEAALRALHEQGIDGVAIGMEARLPLWERPK